MPVLQLVKLSLYEEDTQPTKTRSNTVHRLNWTSILPLISPAAPLVFRALTDFGGST